MTSPRERLIEEGRIPTASTIRDRILNRITDGAAIIKEEQITAGETTTLKYGLLNSTVTSIDKVIITRDGYDIVAESGTDYYLGTGINADTLIFYDSSKTPDSGTSMWVDYTYQDTDVTGITKKETGGVAWLLADAFAQQLAEAYGNLAYYANQTYVDTASGSYLEMLGELVGIERQDAAKATGIVEVVNNSDEILTISSGATVSTIPRRNNPAYNVKFTSNHNLSAGGSGSYNVESENAGDVGIGINMIKKIVSGFSRTSDIIVSNSEPIGGGQNEETDTNLRTRIKTAFDFSGESNRATIDAIKSAVLNCDGVEHCEVYDAWYCSVNNITDLTPTINLNGFVNCYIQLESKDSIFNTPIKIQQMSDSNVTKSTIRDAINDARAAGCTVWLLDIQDVLIDIVATAEAKGGYTAGNLETEIETEIKDYINNQLDIGDDIYTSDITSLIYNIEGVKENSVTCTMYEATPLYQIGNNFSNRMWKLDNTKKAPVYVIVYDVATGTNTSSEVTMTFDYYDNEGDKQTDGSITIPINTSLWVLNSPTTPSVSNNTRRIENVSATGITDGDKFQFRSRRESSWIVVRTAQKAWAGIIDISVS